ncbi:MAG TPA: hypothetical protein ENH90_01955 [bacterium]|nr:hypothetical protein [bacterium]
MNKKILSVILLTVFLLAFSPIIPAVCIPFLEDCRPIILLDRGSNEDVNYTWFDTMEFAFEQPSKNVDVEIIGAQLIISSSSSIDSSTPINISTGISKLKLAVLSGVDTIGDITINAVKHDRDTGVTTEPFSETLALSGIGDTNMTTEWIGNKTASNDINLTTTNFDGVLELTQWSFYQNAKEDFNIIRISVTIETGDTASAKSFDFNLFKIAGDGNVTSLVEFNDIDFAPNGIARNRIYRLDRDCVLADCFIDTALDGIHAAFDQTNIETVEIIITYEFTRQVQLSGVAGNNVTRLLAGSNITLSPATGLGDVTISSTGGGAITDTTLDSNSSAREAFLARDLIWSGTQDFNSTTFVLSGSNVQLNLSQNGDVNALTFTGSGASLTNIPASAITPGTFGGSTLYTFPGDFNTNGDYLVGGPSTVTYAFRFGGNPDVGLVFDATGGGYNFRDTSGGEIFAINVGTGQTTIGQGITSNTEMLSVIESINGGRVAIEISNKAGGGSTDETSELIFKSAAGRSPAGKIVSTRIGNYTTAATVDSGLEFYTALNNNDVLALSINENADSTFVGDVNFAGGNLHLAPQATAPATCVIGDFYVDTSGAYCGCSSTNTWENMLGTGTCS